MSRVLFSFLFCLWCGEAKGKVKQSGTRLKNECKIQYTAMLFKNGSTETKPFSLVAL